MKQEDVTQWGLLGTSMIAEHALVPAVAASGRGSIRAVGSRSIERAAHWCERIGLDAAAGDYESILADDSVQAVYISLPNSLHAEWAAKALRAGKAVLCEKPLCLTSAQVHDLLAVARQCAGPLWDALAFLFHPQTDEIRKVITAGMIGDVRHIESSFNFLLADDDNIRHDPALGGGAAADLLCYPMTLAGVVFDAPLRQVLNHRVVVSERGVDVRSDGTARFDNGGTLDWSCSMLQDETPGTRIVGSLGEIRMSNPYHPRDHDTFEVWRDQDLLFRYHNETSSFAAMIEHIHFALRGVVAPGNLAGGHALATALALESHREIR